MKIFRTINNLLKPAPIARYGLSVEEADELKMMLGTPGWNAYIKLLSNYAEFQGQAMIHCSDDAQLHCARGLIQGLQSGPLLVDSIIQGEQKRNEHERERQLRAESAGIDTSTGALYGTSLWPSR